jgi:hypothetical protein
MAPPPHTSSSHRKIYGSGAGAEGGGLRFAPFGRASHEADCGALPITVARLHFITSIVSSLLDDQSSATTSSRSVVNKTGGNRTGSTENRWEPVWPNS